MAKSSKFYLLPKAMPEIVAEHHAEITFEQRPENQLWFYSIEMTLKTYWLKIPVSNTQQGAKSKDECLTAALFALAKRISPWYFDDMDERAICEALLEQIARLGTKGQMSFF